MGFCQKCGWVFGVYLPPESEVKHMSETIRTFREQADKFSPDLPITSDLFSDFAESVDELLDSGKELFDSSDLFKLAAAFSHSCAHALARLEALVRGVDLDLGRG